MNIFSKILSAVATKYLVRAISKSNPYAIAAVSVYDLYNTISSVVGDSNEVKPGKL